MTEGIGGPKIEKLEIMGDYLGESCVIHEIVSGIKDVHPVQISKSFAARKSTPPEVHGARSVLPGSGRKIAVKHKSDDLFLLRAIPQKDVVNISNDSVFLKSKIELKSNVLDDFLSLLRLVQLGLIAQSSRFSDNQITKREPFPLTKEMIDALEGLDDFVDGGADENELKDHLANLERYHEMWRDKFNASVKDAELTLNSGNEKLDVRSLEYESLFCLLGDTSNNIHPRDYLNEALDSSITAPICDVLFDGLHQLYVIESPPVKNKNVSWILPQIKLRLQANDDMYASQRAEAKRLLSLLDTGSNDLRKEMKKILDILEEDNQIKKLIDTPPSMISARLNTVLLTGNFDDVIRERLDTHVPGVTEYLNKQDASMDFSYKEIFTKTEYLRNEIVILQNVLSRIDKQIEALRNGKGGQTEASRLQTEWAKLRGELHELKLREQSIQSAGKEIDDLRTKILKLERDLKRKQTNVNTDGSVLWLGLGQAGQSILRECLLYCLDNLNDARCSALIRSLGIQDINALNGMMLRSKSGDTKIQDKAEKDLRNLFHQQLHVLAMNLGGEIDDLVMPTEPGYYLWGNEVPESDYSTVRRKTMNTIKLDPKQDGAGGKTGVGRAFAFGRANELKDALRDTGSKNGNAPSHIIVTHSFAGGSGSGMVLPVLQLLRSMFDSDAMIWVVSVGEGLSEQRISADYNTPFILSDVLQAHYDGIHSAIDPFRIGEWDGYKNEFEQYQERMAKGLNELKSHLSDSSADLKGLESVDRNKSLQIQRAREEGKSTLKGLIDDVGKTVFSAWEKVDLEKDPYDLIPVVDVDTEAFNSWCDVYDKNGERPAVKFWNAFVNYIVDPLGAVVDCREQGKEQQKKSDSSDDYVPNITSAHIAVALNEAEIKLFPSEFNEANAGTGDEDKKRHSQNLRILVMYLTNQINLCEEKTRRESFEKAKQILENYGRELDAFNTLRRDLTNRVKALSKAGNDRGVKSIVISNAHLERGVSKSGIPVEENTYTVYNAVVFDVIMNIIGSQLPSTDYISGKMEYFDRTDLDNHSLPPMAVGLLQQNDALSLAEPPATSLESSANVKSIKSNIHSSKVFDELFGSNTSKLVDEMLNPFASLGLTAGGKPSMFFESYFGIRTQSMLHINPYDVIGVSPSEALQDLTDAIEKNWGEPSKKIANIDFDERQSYLNDGFTSLSLVNMLRWLSLLEPETLKKCMGLKQFKNSEMTEAIRAKIPGGFVFSESEKNFELTRYEYESGSISVTDYGKQFTNLGILNEELLAFAPPALLNSYLPLAILEDKKKDIVKGFVPSDVPTEAIGQFQEILSSAMSDLIDHYEPTHAYDPNRIQHQITTFKQIQTLGFFPSLQKAFDKQNLQLTLVEYDNRETINICLHPRLTRYFSVFRDVVSKKSKTLFPSTSVAGSFSRYLAADSPESTIGTFSSPTFSLASEDMERLSFMGLLPDEHRLSWPSFLRIVLFSGQDVPAMEKKLEPLSSSIGLELPVFKGLIEELSNHSPLKKINIGAPGTPESVVHLGKTLLSRLLSLEEIETKYGLQRRVEKHTMDHWKARVERLRGEEIEVFDESSLRYLVQFLLQLVKEDTQGAPEGDSPEEPAQVSETEHSELENDIVGIDRLLYEIATNLSEMLSQAEYMSKEHSADRVHFKMSGFSDRLVGKPKGLLIQVHTASTYRENFDMVKTAIRSSIQQSVGFIQNSKEFQTKSNFGPRASVTISLSQAPLNEAGTTYRGLMKKLAGADPESYIEETKLHPYVFLYNVLWLSARLEKWTNLENTAFARRFVIPLQVIQDHYSKPGRIEGAVNALVKDSIFLKGVSLPQDDIRDYTSSRKSEERYRSIPYLVSMLALRHFNTCTELAKQTDDKQFKEEIERIKETYNEEIQNLCADPVLQRSGLGKRGASAYTLLLEDENFGSDGAGESGPSNSADPMATLMATLGKRSELPSASDTILERTKAWFEAHKAWNRWAEGKGTMDEED